MHEIWKPCCATNPCSVVCSAMQGSLPPRLHAPLPAPTSPSRPGCTCRELLQGGEGCDRGPRAALGARRVSVRPSPGGTAAVRTRGSVVPPGQPRKRLVEAGGRCCDRAGSIFALHDLACGAVVAALPAPPPCCRLGGKPLHTVTVEYRNLRIEADALVGSAGGRSLLCI